MGTPAASAYATVTYGHFENLVIFLKFQKNLLYHCRYIDDILGNGYHQYKIKPTPGINLKHFSMAGAS